MGSLDRTMRRRAARTEAAKAPGAAIEPVSAANSEIGRDELYFVIEGQRVAKRGYPGTPQAGTWVPLKEGVRVVTGDAADATWADGLPDDTPITDGGEVQLFEEPKGGLQ
jgi:hypothetical protein